MSEAPRIIRIRQRGLWDALLPLHESNGMVFVRQEYADIYNRMEHAETSELRLEGTIITGNPGIGAYLDVVFAFRKHLTLRQASHTSHFTSYFAAFP